MKDITPSVDCSHSRILVRDVFGYTPEAPLVNLCALNSVSSEKSGMASSEIFGNRDGLAEVALWSFEERELASEVLGFEFL